MPNECQPAGPIGFGVTGPVVLRQDTTHHILVDLDAKGMSDLLGSPHAAEHRVAVLHLNDRGDQFCRGTFGAWLAATVTRKTAGHRAVSLILRIRLPQAKADA